MANDADVKVGVSVEDNATDQLKQIQKQIGQISKEVGGLRGVMSQAAGSFSTFAKGFASAFTVDKVVSFVKGSINLADSLLTTAQNIGFTVEEFTALRYAASVSGVEFKQFETGLTRFVNTLGEAQDASSKQAAIFRTLGIDAKKAFEDPQQAFTTFATKFAQIKSPVDQLRLAIDIFGKDAGPAFVEFLKQGADKIELLKIKAQELGVVLDTETAQGAKDANDEIGTLSQVIGISAASASKELIPALITTVKALTDASNGGSAMTTIFQVITSLFKGTAYVVSYLASKLLILGKYAGGTAAIFASIATGDFKAANFIFEQMNKDVDNIRSSWVKYTDALLDSKPIQKAVTDDVKRGGIVLGDYGKSADAATKATNKLSDEFDKLVLSIQKEIDGYIDLSRAEQIKWQISHGELDKFLPKQRELLLLKSQELDLIKRIRVSIDSYTQTALQLQNEFASSVAQTTVTLQDQEDQITQIRSGASQSDIELLTRNQQATQSYRERAAALFTVIGIQEKLILAIKASGDTSPEVQKQLQDAIKLTDQSEAELAAIKQLVPILEQKRLENEKNLVITRENTKELASWKELIGGAKDETEKFNYQWELLDKWLADGVINLGQYINLQDQLMEQGNQAVQINKDASDEITEFWKKAAQSMQGAMSDFFFDVMQGNMNDLVGSFKKTIDRMVADLLASQLMTYLLGSSFGKGGNIGGLIGSVFGGFKAAGGDVSAGTSYIVGEKGPELFTPTTNGNITPNGAMGGNVTIQISALDGADVMKVLHGSRKQIADMVSGSRMAYNLR